MIAPMRKPNSRLLDDRLADPEHNAFVVELAHFTGPLDLLLSLIRDEQPGHLRHPHRPHRRAVSGAHQWVGSG